MVFHLSLLSFALSAGFASVAALPGASVADTCGTIAKRVSSATKVYYPGSTRYEADNYHFAASNSEVSACAVEPATAEDVGVILKTVGEDQTQFAVWSAGHWMNPKGSSTTGVQIALNQFNGTKYDPATRTAVIGSGQPWTDVYATLERFNVSVPGVRIKQVGVGGYLLGGGYAFTSSEVGLGFDSVIGYELVKPDGTVINVSATENPDLFWGLKGGYSNFGIVTRFTMQTYPQGLVYAGNVIVGADQVDAVAEAIAAFDEAANNDPKAVSFCIFQHTKTDGARVIVNLFYDGQTAPAGLFDAFLALPAISNTVRTRTFLDFVLDTELPGSPRAIWDHLPVEKYPVALTQAIAKENSDMAALLSNTSYNYVHIVVEPYKRDLLQHAAQLPGFPTPSAWPPQRDVLLMPSLTWAGWDNEEDDEAIHNAIKDANIRLRQKAASLDQDAAALDSPKSSKYPNYSAFWTTPEEIYGSNLPILQQIKKAHDPNNVMGLAGGFKL